MKYLGTSLLCMGLSVSAAYAQRDLAAGFGSQSLVIDLDAATGEIYTLGVQHLRGEIFVTLPSSRIGSRPRNQATRASRDTRRIRRC